MTKLRVWTASFPAGTLSLLKSNKNHHKIDSATQPSPILGLLIPTILPTKYASKQQGSCIQVLLAALGSGP